VTMPRPEAAIAAGIAAARALQSQARLRKGHRVGQAVTHVACTTAPDTNFARCPEAGQVRLPRKGHPPVSALCLLRRRRRRQHPPPLCRDSPPDRRLLIAAIPADRASIISSRNGHLSRNAEPATATMFSVVPSTGMRFSCLTICSSWPTSRLPGDDGAKMTVEKLYAAPHDAQATPAGCARPRFRTRLLPPIR
jgi:hypothetical protein